MGSGEARLLLDYLRSEGALTARTARRYVLGALYDSELLAGTNSYRALRFQATGEVVQETTSDEEPLSGEAVDYLAGLLGTVSGRGPVLDTTAEYDGFSPEAYQEMRQVLGPDGLRRLGVEGRSLAPDPEVRKEMQVREYATRMQRLAEAFQEERQAEPVVVKDEPDYPPGMPLSIFEKCGDPPPYLVFDPHGWDDDFESAFSARRRRQDENVSEE